ncbi:MAG: EVE domain-containing protein, partial [bacterium]
MTCGRDLNEVLDLVGTLDDSPGEDTARERFRSYLKRKVTSVGVLRDYVEECLRHKGDNYNRALQDLVNYIGHFL